MCPERSVFTAREFSSFDSISKEFAACDIAMLLPHQLEMFPADSFDVTFNISSFGEMSRGQIEKYFATVGRVTKGYFYFKQWLESKNPFDGLLLAEKDYPVPDTWRKFYSRRCAVQTEFFEALYATRETKA